MRIEMRMMMRMRMMMMMTTTTRHHEIDDNDDGEMLMMGIIILTINVCTVLPGTYHHYVRVVSTTYSVDLVINTVFRPLISCYFTVTVSKLYSISTSSRSRVLMSYRDVVFFSIFVRSLAVL